MQRQNVLSHERAHLARRDHWWKPLGFALLAVYWFNPVLWLAYTLLCRDIELACDERVIRTMDESAVKTYSTVLLACSMPRKTVITCPLAFGEVGVKERVKNALHYKRPAFWVVAASVAVCVVVAVCFLTDPEHETMKWAKSLRVEDVARIEQINMTRTPDKQYKDLDAEEFAEIVALINKSVGRYQKETELLNAGPSLSISQRPTACGTRSSMMPMSICASTATPIDSPGHGDRAQRGTPPFQRAFSMRAASRQRRK